MIVQRLGWCSLMCLLAGLSLCVGSPLNRLTLAWNPSTSPGVAGYRLYLGVVSHVYTTALDLGNSTTATLPNLTPGVKYFFAVTAYDTNREESAFSAEITSAIQG